MKYTEYADAIDKQIDITYYSNQDCRFSAQFHNCEVKEGAILGGVYGNGKTPIEAIKDYFGLIKGKRIVFSAYGKDRQEFTVPKNIEVT